MNKLNEIIIALKAGRSIKTIDLFRNKIGDKDVELLVQALLQNNTVEFINLDYNQIGNKGAMSIAKLLQGNNSIKRIDLYHNKIGNKGVQCLVEALKKNNCLLILELFQNNKIKPSLQKDITELLGRNALKTVKKLPNEDYQEDQVQEDSVWQWLEKNDTSPIFPKTYSSKHKSTQTQLQGGGVLDKKLQSITQKLKEIQQQLCIIIEEIDISTQHPLLQERPSQSSSLLGNTSLIDSYDSTTDLVYTI
ncbi:MAG: hypothetical protein LN568_05580 [Rickettsia endosymbiont of Pseudomimeciton antennatum]|nr:hypothetical protein [Rickettsia endosymbiont of Pseudomimeciton antennatum]